MIQIDWNQARAFSTTADSGSLSAAARELGLTQPTLSRQVIALEESLGVTLFERVGKRLELTDAGRELLVHARKMSAAADAMELAATGKSEAIEGFVSISATDGISHYLLPPALSRIRKAAPGLKTEIVVSNSLSDLLRREADIAVRHVRPTEPDLFAKLLRQTEAGFYASRSWVTENGHPVRPEDVSGAPFIGFDRSERFAEHLRTLGLTIDQSTFPVICDNSVIVLELVRRGFGIAVMMKEIAEQCDDLVEVLSAIPTMEFPIWLVTHRELHTSRKIRLVFDILAEELGRV